MCGDVSRRRMNFRQRNCGFRLARQRELGLNQPCVRCSRNFPWRAANARYSPPVLALEEGRPDEAEILSRIALILYGAGPDGDPALVDGQVIAVDIQNHPVWVTIEQQ